MTLSDFGDYLRKREGSFKLFGLIVWPIITLVYRYDGKISDYF